MNLESISTISCETRNNYDKNICENLNPDKISNFLSTSSYFDKNKYLVDSKEKTINNFSKEECASYSIENNYKGFTYNGDKNKCLIYDSHNLKEDESNDFNHFKKKTFLKTKDTININSEDQLDPTKYFDKTNNNKYIYKNSIDEITVNNELECLDRCLNNYDNKCKAVIYMDTPSECNFYNKIKINNKDILSNDYDTYTLNKNLMKSQKELTDNLLKDTKNNDKIYNYCTLKDDKCIIDNKSNIIDNSQDNIKNDIPLYDCNGIYSTNPFCTKEYSEDDYKEYTVKKEKDKYLLYTDCINTKDINNIEKENSIYNDACKKKYGNEYIFDNDLFNIESKLECEDGNVMAKCKLDFEDKFILESSNSKKKRDYVEHFNNDSCDSGCDAGFNSNYDLQKNNIHNICLIVIFIISILLIILLGKIWQ
jgi:hypothetical protein